MARQRAQRAARVGPVNMAMQRSRQMGRALMAVRPLACELQGGGLRRVGDIAKDLLRAAGRHHAAPRVRLDRLDQDPRARLDDRAGGQGAQRERG
jgi:hypothetical protein